MKRRTEEPLLTTSELAAHLAITEKQVLSLYKQSAIPGYNFGHRTLRFDLREVLAARYVPAADDDGDGSPPIGAGREMGPAPDHDPLPPCDWSEPR